MCHDAAGSDFRSAERIRGTIVQGRAVFCRCNLSGKYSSMERLLTRDTDSVLPMLVPFVLNRNTWIHYMYPLHRVDTYDQ